MEVLAQTCPMGAKCFTRSSFYAYRRGDLRLSKERLNNALTAFEGLTRSNRTKNQSNSIRRLFKHGPRSSELWAALDGRISVEDAAARWNTACLKALADSGVEPYFEVGDNQLPSYAEAISDYSRHLGDSELLLQLSRSIIKLRVAMNTLPTRRWVPISTRNMNLTSSVGELCEDRTETPLFVSPKVERSTVQEDARLDWAGYGHTRSMIKFSKVELEEFGIDAEKLERSIRRVAESEVYKVRCHYATRH